MYKEQSLYKTPHILPTHNHMIKKFIKPTFMLYSNQEDQGDVTIEKLSNEIYFSNIDKSEKLSDIFKLQNDQKGLQVVLVGDPGSGKTTIVNEIVCSWANDDMLNNIKLLLIVNFQDINLHKHSIKNFQNLLKFLNVATKCAAYFERLAGEGLMIILDGYHEPPTAAKNLKISQFFVSLVGRKILPKCTLMMTTQTAISLSVNAHSDQIRIAKIVGLCRQARNDYLINYLSPETYQLYFENRTCIDYLCYNPWNLEMFLCCINSDPSTSLKQADLIDKYINMNISHVSGHTHFTCTQKEFIMTVKKSLALLAYEKLVKGKFVFSEKTFKKYQFKKDYVTYSLLPQDESKADKYTFAHAIIQTYLAALHILRNGISCCRSWVKFDRPHLYFLKIYAAICKKTPSLLPVKENSYLLIFPGISEEFEERKVNWLQLHYILSDADNSQATININNYNNVVNGIDCSVDLSDEELSLRDVDCLIFFIQNFCSILTWNSINLCGCKLGDKGCGTLCKALPVICNCKNITIKSLNVSDNKLKSLSLSDVGNIVKTLKIKELVASHNVFTNGEFSSFADSELEQLDLSSNHLQSCDIVHLCQALRRCKNLKHLSLNNNHISDQVIAELIISMEKWNEFLLFKSDDPHINDLLLFIKRKLINVKNLNDEITFNDSTVDIKYFIKFLQYTKDVSDATSNFIYNITKILSLSLQCNECGMIENECISLTVGASEFFVKFKNLSTLNLSGIHIDEQAANSLAKAFECKSILQTLEHLTMNGCHLTSNSLTNLVQALHSSNRIKEFHACNNLLCDKVTEALAIAIFHWKSLKTLDIFNGNHFTKSSRFLLNLLLTVMCDKILDQPLCISDSTVKAFLAILNNLTSSKTNHLFLKNASKIIKISVNCIFPNTFQLSTGAGKLIKCFECLQELNITGLSFTENSATALANMLQVKSTTTHPLKILKLINCQLNSVFILQLLSPNKIYIEMLKSLQKIDFSCNAIDDSAVYSIVTSILQMPCLTDITMNDNPFSQYDVNIIFKIINDCKRHISVISYDLDEQVSAFVSLLSFMNDVESTKLCQVKNVTMITELNLRYHRSTVVLSENAASFFTRFTKLTKLNMTGICIKPGAVNILTDCLANNLATLEELTLSHCQLDYDSLVTILHYEKESTPLLFNTLKKLNFDHNCITENAMKPLLISVLKMPNLTLLSIDDNPLKSQVIKIAFGILLELKISKQAYTNKVYSVDYVNAFLLLLNSAANVSSSISLPVHNLINLKKLTIICSSCAILTAESALFFKRFIELEELKFSRFHIESKVVNVIANTLSRNLCTLKFLILSKCHINSESVIDLLLPLSTLRELTELDLSYNNIKDDAIYSIIESLLQIPKLMKVNFDGNPLSESNMLAISRITSDFNTYISTLDYSDRPDKDIYICSLFTILASMKNVSDERSYQVKNISAVTKIKLICLSSKIPIVMTKDVASCFCRLTNLQELNLSGVCIEHNSETDLVNALKCCSLLEDLILNNCGLDSDFVIAIVSSLHKDKLRELCLSQNDCINYKSVCAINTFMYNNKTLHVLNLSSNALKDNEAKVLSDGLVHCKSLQILDLSNNRIADEAISSLVASFLQMPSLSKIFIDGNQFNYDINTIIELIMDFKSFRSIRNFDSISYVVAFLNLLSYMKNVETTRSHQVKNVTMTTELNIHYHRSTVVLSENAASFFTRFTKLTKLNITGVCIKPGAVKVLADCLANNLATLEELTLSHCQLDYDSLVTILHYEKESTPLLFNTLKKLNFDHNCITKNAMKPLLASVLKMPNLTLLSIDDNPLKSQVIKIAFGILLELKISKQAYTNKVYSVDYVNAFLLLLNSAANVSSSISLPVHNLMNLKKLTIICSSCAILTAESALFFKRFIELEELKLSGFHIGSKVVNVIANTLSRNLCTLKFLILSMCCINSKSVIDLLLPLSTLHELTELDLNHNNIKDVAIYSIIESLLQIPKLMKVNFDGNPLSESNMLAISRITSDFNTYISTLDYSDRPDKDIYISSLFTILASMKNVSDERSYQVKNILAVTKIKLICMDNKIPILMTKDVVSCFCRLTYLQELNLSGVCIERNSETDLVNALKCCSLLEDLILNNCGLDSDFVIAIVSSLHKDKLRELCLSQNDCINYKAVCAINAFMYNNKTLHVLNLSSNALNDEEAKVLSDGLVHCKSLQHLDLSNNRIADEAIPSLVASFLQMPSLSKIFIDGNQFNYDINTIIELIMDFKSFSSIRNFDSISYVVAFLNLLSCMKNVETTKSHQVKNVTLITKLSLQYLHNTNVLLTKNTALFFTRLTELTNLSFSGINIKAEALNIFANALANIGKSLKQLTLCHCQLDSESVLTIFNKEKCELFPKLTSLKLNNNNITDTAADSLVSAIFHMPVLTELNLNDNKFEYINMKMIFNIMLDFKHIKSSIDNERENDLVDYTIAVLALFDVINRNFSTLKSSLQVCNITCIKYLNLSCVYHKTAEIGLTENAASFMLRFVYLEYINLSGICIQSNVINILGCLITQCCKSLHSLILRKCQLNSKSAMTLLTCRSVVFECLVNLDVSCNNIGSELMHPLIASILQMNILADLNFAENKLNQIDEAVIHIITSDLCHFKPSIDYSNKQCLEAYTAAFLRLLESMESIAGSNSYQKVKNIIEIRELNLPCAHLKTSLEMSENASLFFYRFTNLTKLNISGISIKPKVVKIIANALNKSLHYLKVLRLSHCQLNSNSTLILLCCYQKTPKFFDELTELDLSKNNIKSSAIPMVISSLFQMTKLSKTNFEDNKLTNSDMKAIESVISEFNCPKTSIDYSDAEVSVNAFLILLEGMRTLTVERSSQIRNIINIRKLCLDCFKSKKPLMLTKNASLFLQNFEFLKELSLSGIRIQEEAIKAISGALNSKLCLLQVLKLSRCKLNSYSAIEILSSCNLENLIDLKELDLSYNNIKDDAIYSIIESLLQIPKSVKVNLDGNPLSESNMLAISRITSDFNTYISTLDYSDRPDKDIYISSLFTILASMKNVSDKRSYQVKNILAVTKIKLICMGNKIPIVVTKDVASCFCRLINLQELNLSGVCIECNSAFALENALKCYSSLERLILNNCGLDSDFVIAIVSSLHKDKLRELCLSQNDCINYKAVCAINTFMYNNKTLRVLNLSSNALKDNEIKVLSDGLVHCKSLQHLDLSNNRITDVSKLLTAFLQIDSLRKVQFENNAAEKVMKIAFDIIVQMRTPQTSYKVSDDDVKAFLTLLSSAANVSSNNSRSVQHLTKLKTLNLQCSSYTMLTTESSSFFKNFDVMEEIQICRLHVQPSAITNIADTLSKNLCTLKVLCLSNCQLDSNSAVDLLSPYKVSVLPELTELDLSYNNIKDDAIYSIIESLLQIPKLIKVKFNGNRLSESNMLAISRVTSDFNSCISTLDYSDRPDKDIYISSLFTILASMKNVSDERSYQVKNILAVTKIKLICVDSKIPIVITKDIDVVSCFCRLINLQELNLNGVCIEYDSEIACENALKCYSSLESLMLNNCDLDSDFVIAMVSSLRKDKLRELCLSQNKCINYKAVREINTFMYNNKTLCVLNLSSNALNDEKAIILSDGLVHCKSLQQLDLSNNRITDNALSKLLTAFLQSDTLRKVQFENNAIEKIMKIAFDIIIQMRTPKTSYKVSDHDAKAFLALLSSAANVSSDKSRSVRHLAKLKRLNLQCSSYVMLTTELSSFFEKFDVMEEIKICGLHVQPSSITNIADTLSKSLHTLKVLCLINCRLDSNSAVDLLSPYKVSVLPELTELDLSYNNIKDDAIYSIIESLLQIPKLVKVNFNHNPLNESNMLAISRITSNFNTGKAPLDYNTTLDSEAFHTLLSSTVNISKGRSHQVESIIKAKHLSLQCSRCPIISYFEMSNNFSLFVMKFDSLHTLKIDGIHINLNAIYNIAKALESNLVSLRVLSLNHCNLRAIGSIKLANSLKNCKNLHTLDLAYNKITDEAAETLTEVVKHLYQYKLKNLNIDNNELSHSNVTKIKSKVYWGAYLFGW